MAGGADHEGLAPPVRHGLGPLGLQRPGYAEVCELADVVDLDLARLLADLADAREEPVDQLLVRIVDPDRLAVDDRRRSLPVERYAAEPCDQWLSAVAFDTRLEAGAQPVRCLDFGLVLGRRLRRRRAVLSCQGFEHGGLHDPAQPVKSVDVSGQQVVLDDAPVDGPEGGHDGVVVAVGQGLLLGGFAAVQVGGTLLALITSSGTRNATCPLTVRRRRVALLSLCWTVMSAPRHPAAPVQAWVISVL